MIRILVLVAFLTAACSNYDFAAARRPDGSYDLPKLVADLEASGEESLTGGTWLPLLHLDVESFERADNLEGGYELVHVDAYGPLFFAGGIERRLYTPKLQQVEADERDWLALGLLYWSRDNEVASLAGPRHERERRVLLLFGKEHVHYWPTPAESPAAGAANDG